MPQFGDYFLDQTNENARLLRQHEQMKALIGGLVPSEIEASTVRQALDLACGPGAWALDVARTYPQAEVTGVDASAIALAEGRRLASREHLDNVHFRGLNLTEATELPFPDNSFDLVWARMLFNHLRVAAWEPVLHEVHRILRPDGAIVVVDIDAFSGAISNAEYQRLKDLVNTLLVQSGRMPRFGALGPAVLRRIGFNRLWTRPMLYPCSLQQGDQPVPEWIYRMQANLIGVVRNARAAILDAKLISAEEFDHLYEAALQKFEGTNDEVLVELVFAISGRKPEHASARSEQ
jgi:ubiquinone/menaquinone biosynthesis C-methylase UbiE